MSNGLSRLATRFLGEPDQLAAAGGVVGQELDAEAAERLGLITFARDDIDWDNEVRLFLEERASFSADALTGLEANLRFAGPETMESKIFARLTAWQNWIFQRPNAVGPEGALRRYGTGQKPVFDTKRVSGQRPDDRGQIKQMALFFTLIRPLSLVVCPPKGSHE